jgi:hypothetical protein
MRAAVVAISAGAVEARSSPKLGLPSDDARYRPVLAVLGYLKA